MQPKSTSLVAESSAATQGMDKTSRHERTLVFSVLLLIVLSLLLPAIPQGQDYHGFADARTLLGIPRALDALSNVGFLSAGAWGLLLLIRGELVFFSRALAASCAVFFVGFIATAVGSTYYHVAPDDARLAWDRAGMVIAFAGMLGMAAAHRVSERAGFGMLMAALALGPASVLFWAHTGSVTPYAMMQFGGIGLAAALMCLQPRGRGPNWNAILATYALAKLCEMADAQIFQLSAGLVSGHTLKHLLAALPVLAVTTALRRPRS